jgi:hypothetical protein
MAKKKAAPGKPATSRQHSLVWLQGLLCGAMAALATPTALLLGVLLGPALLAVVFDREPGRPHARSIALCSMAGSVDPLRTLWTVGHSMATATSLVSNVQVVGTAWSAAAAGWLLAEVTPIAVRAALEGLSIARAAHLRAERAKLLEAWEFELAQNDQ